MSPPPAPLFASRAQTTRDAPPHVVPLSLPVAQLLVTQQVTALEVFHSYFGGEMMFVVPREKPITLFCCCLYAGSYQTKSCSRCSSYILLVVMDLFPRILFYRHRDLMQA